MTQESKDIVFWTVIAFACMGMYCVIMTTLCFAILLSIARSVNQKHFPVDVKTDMLRASKEAINAIKAEDVERRGR